MQTLIVSLMFGGFIALVIWNIYKIFDEVPEEDRSYLDRPPKGFRLVWPLVQLFVYYFGGFVTRNYRIVTHLRLKQAGMEYSLSPEQFMAGKVISALVAVAFSYLLASMLGSGLSVLVLFTAVMGFYYPELWLKEVTQARNKEVFRSLPFYLDIITLSVESGSNLTGGLTQSVKKAPDGPLRLEFGRVLRDVRAGKPRADALREMTERTTSDGIANVVSSLIQAEKTGSSLGPVLRAQSDQLRTMRFLKAEKMAMEAPVKLLGPLVMFIFPNTFLVVLFLLISKAVGSGVLNWSPLVWALTWPNV